MGARAFKRAFAPNDNTHHNNYGSYELARSVVEGIRAAKLGMAKYLINDTPRFDPAHPDKFESFNVPASPLNTNTKPAGN